MNQETIITAIKKAKESSKKRNFRQTIELIVNLKGLDMKKNQNLVDFFTVLHYSKGKKTQVCALVGPELQDSAKESCDLVIMQSDFEKVASNKAELKTIAATYDYFVAQANIMPKVATAFGKVLGPKGKMPNPKAGCVVPPKTNLKPLAEKLGKTVRINTKGGNAVIQVPIGNEEMDEKEVADNCKTVFDQIVHHLPGELNNIKSALVKLTMGVPIKVD
ncbi:MAG: 50S ribosomal protein L1 [archaeon]